jgi:hypothetical protein
MQGAVIHAFREFSAPPPPLLLVTENALRREKERGERCPFAETRRGFGLARPTCGQTMTKGKEVFY